MPATTSGRSSRPPSCATFHRSPAILRNVARGGFAEAVIRMLIILAEARGSVRRDRLQRSSHILTHDEPFVSLGAEQRGDLIHEQTVIVEFERERAIDALPLLLRTAVQRDKAIAGGGVHRRPIGGDGTAHARGHSSSSARSLGSRSATSASRKPILCRAAMPRC